MRIGRIILAGALAGTLAGSFGGSGGSSRADGSGGAGGSGGSGGTHPASIQAALMLFATCMSQADFDNFNVADVANQDTSQGPCYSCHSTGTAGTFLSQNSQDI